MILNSKQIKSDGFSFDNYLDEIKSILLSKVTDMDEETATTHVEMTKSFYEDCYNDDLTPNEAALEDISNWEQD